MSVGLSASLMLAQEHKNADLTMTSVNPMSRSAMATAASEQVASDNAEGQQKENTSAGTTALSKDTRWNQLLRDAMMGVGAAMDIDSTNKAMRYPQIEEGNSWLYGQRPSMARLIATKAAINIPIALVLNKVAKTNPGVARVLSAITGGTQAIAGLQNYQNINSVKK